MPPAEALCHFNLSGGPSDVGRLARAAANSSPRGQRVAILASPLHVLTGFCLAVDCLASGCHGERSFAVAELAASTACIGRWGCRRVRRSGACGGRIGAAWLVTGADP
jgi:hypothetical protein